MNKCPNCNANSNRIQQISEGLKCTVCQTVFKITESGAVVISPGQTFLGEVSPNTPVF